MSESKPITPENELLQAWGFSKECPESLLQHAADCVRLRDKPVGEIVVAMGLADRASVEEALAVKPSNVLSLEHLSSYIPALQPSALRVLAVSRAYPYFDTILDSWVEAGVKLPATARARLDELSAAYLVTPDGPPIVVFADMPGLLSFSQAGRLEKRTDPIRSSVSEPIGVGLAPPSVVARAARNEGTQENTNIVSGEMPDNFWSSSLAKTEGERILGRILDEALSRKATDIAFAPGRDGTTSVLFRIFGDLAPPERHATLNPQLSKETLNFFMSKSRASDGSRLRGTADGMLSYKNTSAEATIRTSFIAADRSGQDFDMISASVRIMPKTARDLVLRNLNVAPLVITEVRKSLMKSQGLIVLAGPTNSGKSTTIAGIVGEHYELYGDAKKRLSLEDPVERYLKGITQIRVDNNFPLLMRALLRHDPDMVWVGEMRDSISSGACVRASTSGHVVVSTVHANDSIQAFRAISNYLKADASDSTGSGASLFDLAESLSLLIGQRLIKRLCPRCRRPHKLTTEEFDLANEYLVSEGQEQLWPTAQAIFRAGIYKSAQGDCSVCHGTGYIGELPINEVLPVGRQVKDLFTKSANRLDVHELSKYRLNTLAGSALERIAEGDAEFGSFFV